MLKKFILTSIIILCTINAKAANKLKKCGWNNNKGIPCIVVRGTPNTTTYSKIGVTKHVITKQEVINTGASDINDILELVPGLNVFQSGPMGQSTSVFTRGSESNHTLVLLNGIPINDQSVTDGLHDFGQDFIHTIQQIEIYKGPNGSHFGPSAIAGAVNLITAVDYTNTIGVNGFDKNNNSIDGNYTKVTENGWHLNFKGEINNSKTNSAIAGGTEDDAAKNMQVNLNAVKWINDTLKFKSTLYSRNTKADYDGSASDEIGYKSDNKMYAFQSIFDHNSINSEDAITFHYHNYDREYENEGFLDEYDSESLVIKGERKIKPINKISFGYGSEYKYDWGDFENRGSYNASTKGHMKDFSIFGNIGYKINEQSILSFYARSDDHNTAGKNETYKLNFSQTLEKFKFGVTRSTGLRNPSLYELYGTDNYGISGNTELNSEKSKTNEIAIKYNFLNNLSLTSTAYKTKIYDRIETNAAYSKHENELIDLKQEGLESEMVYKSESQTFSIFNNFSKSKKADGRSQSRRPDLTYGMKYNKKFLKSTIGPLNLNLIFKHTGKYVDYDGGNVSIKNTNIANVNLNKNLFGKNYYLSITNLLDEHYEKPATYSQDGRKIKFGFKVNF